MVQTVNVYIAEAHPSDGWEIDSNKSGDVALAAFGDKTEISYTQTKTLEDRLRVANSFHQTINGEAAQIPMVVDDPSSDTVSRLYEAAPERLVLIDESNCVVFATGQGPMQYSLDQLEDFLQTQNGGVFA